MLVNFEDLFNSAVNENCSNERFKYVTQNFTWLKKFHISIVEKEIFLERVEDVSI